MGLAFLSALAPVLLPIIATDPGSVRMQFGQYLTIAPAGAIPLLLFMQAGYAVAVAMAVATLARSHASTTRSDPERP